MAAGGRGHGGGPRHGEAIFRRPLPNLLHAMQQLETRLDGLVLLSPKVHGDKRGFFVETFRADVAAQHGIPVDFVQDNHSRSVQGTLRGLHLQRAPRAQAKLVRVLEGEVFDVAAERFPVDDFELKDHLLTVTVDITSRESIEAGLGEVISRWDTPHGLINNAALAQGGAIYNINSGTIEVTDSIVSNNVVTQAESGVGGAIYEATQNFIVPALNGQLDPAEAIEQMREELKGQM